MIPVVAHTREFDRVVALPRRAVDADLARRWAAALTPIFALHDGVHLRPWQALALAEAVEVGGAWLALPVGLGKTLISWLLPTAMQSERTLIIVPGSLVTKTESDFGEYVRDWRSPPGAQQTRTREILSTSRGDSILNGFAPDLIIIDESDKLSNPRAGAPRKLDRYIREHNPRVVAMTGTPARNSIMGYWHLLAWTLGDGAPMPLVPEEALMWSLAIDPAKRGQRADPGPLGATQASAARWFRKRLSETPGVLIVDEDSCDAPLTIRTRLAREDSALDTAFARFLLEQETPGGMPVSDPLSRWLLDGQLGLGLYSVWDPPPPEDWRSARRAVSRFVRERIDASTHTRRPLDTEAQVLRRYAHLPVVQDWLAIKPTFDGTTMPVWISDSAIESCVDWLHELDGEPGIVWCGSIPFGHRLAERTGLPYYGQRGKTQCGSCSLCEAPEGGSLIASWKANMTGFNLQAWPRQLVTMPPQSAKFLEQIMGRSHRSGQERPVIVDILATSGGTLDAFESTIGEAQRVRDTEGLTQKILRADIVRAQPTVTDSNEFRWARKGAPDEDA